MRAWEETKRSRFDELRRREAQRGLTQPETVELQAQFAELDALEERELASALEKADLRLTALRTQNEKLALEAERLEQICSQYQQLFAELSDVGSGTSPSFPNDPGSLPRNLRIPGMR